MIVVTGAQGFIGSCMVRHLNKMGSHDVVVVDDFEIDHQRGYAIRANYTNLQECKFARVHHISTNLSDILPPGDIRGVLHFGAISNTLERDSEKLNYYNVRYTNTLARVCRERGIPMVFSSSAAVYGNGRGPTNQYAQSKLDSENAISDTVMCFRLFNVYGPKEHHKGNMSSVILKWYNELKQTNKINLFEGSNDYMRDFIHVDDVCRVAYNALANPSPGVYDLGTGTAESFDSLADCLLDFLKHGTKQYIPMPDDLKNQYQRYTKADTTAIVSKGWASEFLSIQKGVKYYLDYLMDKSDM